MWTQPAFFLLAVNSPCLAAVHISVFRWLITSSTKGWAPPGPAAIRLFFRQKLFMESKHQQISFPNKGDVCLGFLLWHGLHHTNRDHPSVRAGYAQTLLRGRKGGFKEPLTAGASEPDHPQLSRTQNCWASSRVTSFCRSDTKPDLLVTQRGAGVPTCPRSH